MTSTSAGCHPRAHHDRGAAQADDLGGDGVARDAGAARRCIRSAAAHDLIAIGRCSASVGDMDVLTDRIGAIDGVSAHHLVDRPVHQVRALSGAGPRGAGHVQCMPPQGPDREEVRLPLRPAGRSAGVQRHPGHAGATVRAQGKRRPVEVLIERPGRPHEALAQVRCQQVAQARQPHRAGRTAFEFEVLGRDGEFFQLRFRLWRNDIRGKAAASARPPAAAALHRARRRPGRRRALPDGVRARTRLGRGADRRPALRRRLLAALAHAASNSAR
jgi:hypothetical protein